MRNPVLAVSFIVLAFMAGDVRADDVDVLIDSLKPSPPDYPVWAARLLNAATELSAKPDAQARVYQAAYTHGIRRAKGFASAMKAAEALIKAKPTEATLWRKRLLYIHRRVWQTAPKDRKKQAVVAYIDQLIAAGQACADAGEPTEALKFYSDANRMVRSDAPKRREELSLRIRRTTRRQKVQNDIRKYMRFLKVKPDNIGARESLIMLYVLEFDDPASAQKHITPDVSETLRTFVPLAMKDVESIRAGECMDLGDWYMSLAKTASSTSKAAALVRGRIYYERLIRLTSDPVKLIAARSKLAEARISRPVLPPELTKGLVLHYDFEAKPDNRVVTDISGSKSHGRYQGARRTEKGRSGAACQLDGSTHVSAPSTLKLGIKDTLSMCAWLRVDKYRPKRGELVTNRPSGIESRGDFIWGFAGSKKMTFEYWSGDDARERSDEAAAPSTGLWHHLAVVVDCDEDSVMTYVDGVPAGKDTQFAKNLLPSKHAIQIGKAMDGGVIGTVDDVMIYTRPLSTYEVSLIYRLQGGRLERRSN